MENKCKIPQILVHKTQQKQSQLKFIEYNWKYNLNSFLQNTKLKMRKMANVSHIQISTLIYAKQKSKTILAQASNLNFSV